MRVSDHEPEHGRFLTMTMKLNLQEPRREGNTKIIRLEKNVLRKPCWYEHPECELDDKLQILGQSESWREDSDQWEGGIWTWSEPGLWAGREQDGCVLNWSSLQTWGASTQWFVSCKHWTLHSSSRYWAVRGWVQKRRVWNLFTLLKFFTTLYKHYSTQWSKLL